MRYISLDQQIHAQTIKHERERERNDISRKTQHCLQKKGWRNGQVAHVCVCARAQVLFFSFFFSLLKVGQMQHLVVARKDYLASHPRNHRSRVYVLMICKCNQEWTYLLSDVLSLGAFISENLFLIITSSPAHIAAALTSSSERPC